MSTLDILIIGGGPAGLAVATGLARQLYTAVVFDSGVYRNARTKHMHNVPTWDHRDPAEFRAKARSDLLARYDTIRFEETKTESIWRTEAGRFEATDGNGKKWTGKKLALASGMTDIYPDIPGYDDVWGRGVYVLYLQRVNNNATGWQHAGTIAYSAMGSRTATLLPLVF
jgi:thioredoxin reductase